MISTIRLWIKDVRFYRYVFYGGNLVFWLLGWGSLFLGIWLYTEDSYSGLAPSSFSSMSAAGLCISTGAMVLIISFIGCIGLWIQSKCLLISYFCFVCLLFVVQCITGVMAYFYRGAVRQRVKYSLYATINRSYAADYAPERNIRITWDHMQSQLHCCGVDNYTNWFNAPAWPRRRFVPDSCCDVTYFDTTDPDAMTNCGKAESNKHMFYKQGCYDLFSDWLLRHLFIVGLIAFLFIIVEVFVLCTALRLLHYLHRREKRRRQHAYADEPSYRYSRNGGAVQDGECTLIANETGDANAIVVEET